MSNNKWMRVTWEKRIEKGREEKSTKSLEFGAEEEVEAEADVSLEEFPSLEK